MKPKKNISVRVVPQSRCLVCQSTDVPYYIQFRDQEHEGREIWRSGNKVAYAPTDFGYACSRHVMEVTCIILKRNGLDAAPAETKETVQEFNG